IFRFNVSRGGASNRRRGLFVLRLMSDTLRWSSVPVGTTSAEVSIGVCFAIFLVSHVVMDQDLVATNPFRKSTCDMPSHGRPCLTKPGCQILSFVALSVA